MVGRRRHEFSTLRELMGRATPLRSGDELAGTAAESAEQRAAAQMCLADVPLRHFLEDLLIPYEEDAVTRLIVDSWARSSGNTSPSVARTGSTSFSKNPGARPRLRP